MYKYFFKIFNIAFLVSMLCLLGGCGKTSESPPPKGADTKKIAVAKKKKKISKPDEKKQAASEAKPDNSVKNVEGKDIAVAAILEQEEIEEEDEVYNPEGKIDPFASSFKAEQLHAVDEAKKKRKRRGHLTPLEKVDISQLALLGTILAPSGNRALVSDTSGKGYVVTEGTYVGIYSGRVAQILRDELIVEEEIENILGKISIRKRSLKIKRPSGD